MSAEQGQVAVGGGAAEDLQAPGLLEPPEAAQGTPPPAVPGVPDPGELLPVVRRGLPGSESQVGLVVGHHHPALAGQKRPGGILYKEGIAKISLFSRACNDDGIPIVWLQDISGFDIGPEAEATGLLGYGSNLIYTNSTNTVPMITVLLRKASGAGYYAQAGMPYDPVAQLATTISRLSVMDGRTLAIGAFNTRLDDNFEIIAETEPLVDVARDYPGEDLQGTAWRKYL